MVPTSVRRFAHSFVTRPFLFFVKVLARYRLWTGVWLLSTDGVSVVASFSVGCLATDRFLRLGLELLSEDEVELASTLLLSKEVLVETVGPIDTHQSYHRQEDANTDTCRALHVEGVELLRVVPSVTSLNEGESVDGSVAQHKRIAQL